MRIFQKPKPNGKMEVSEDIFRNPKELEALKAKVKPEEYLKTLYDKIFSKEKELENLESDSKSKREALELDYAENTARKGKEIASLEDILGIKRAEYAELTKPFIDRNKELDVREKTLVKREIDAKEELQKAFEKDRSTEKKLESLKILTDHLGDIKVALDKREGIITGHESVLKGKETQYLAKIEQFSIEVNKAKALIQERDNGLALWELNLEGRLQNIEQRKTQLEKDKLMLHDRRELLKKNIEEFKRIKN